MKDLKAKLDELNAEFDKKKKDLIAEHAILESVPAHLRKYKVWVHYYEIYGRQHSIQFSTETLTSLAEGTVPLTNESLAEIVECYLPPLALLKVKDGCTSFRPAFWVESELQKADQKWQLEPVAPWTVRLQPSSYSQRTTIEWIVRRGDVVYEIEVQYPCYFLSRAVGNVTGRNTGNQHGNCWENVNWVCPDVLRKSPFGEPKAIKWGRHDKTVLNEYTLYWSNPSLSLIDFAHYVRETCRERPIQ